MQKNKESKIKLQIIEDACNQLLFGIEKLIEQTGRNVALSLNTAISRLYWSMGNYIIFEIHYETYSQHGQQILATLSQRLSWSHFIELVTIEKLSKGCFTNKCA